MKLKMTTGGHIYYLGRFFLTKWVALWRKIVYWGGVGHSTLLSSPFSS